MLVTGPQGSYANYNEVIMDKFCMKYITNHLGTFYVDWFDFLKGLAHKNINNTHENDGNMQKLVYMLIQGKCCGVPAHFTASGPSPMASARKKVLETRFPPLDFSKWYFSGPC